MGQFALPLAMLGIGIIGSMLIGPKQSSTAKPDSMPKLNNATRGHGIPVCFGTNKLSSQVVWSKNYKATRQQGGGKGKGGGSGGFGSAKGANAGTGYQYTWDMMFNFGIADVPMMIRRGWIGGDAINSINISALTSGISDGFIDLFPPGSLTSDKTASLSYTEAFVSSGYPTGDANLINWPYFATQEGVNCAWPYTLYTGFEQLDLGTTPTVPQLFFEWVPLSASSSFVASGNFISAIDNAFGKDTIACGYLAEDDNAALYSVNSQPTIVYVTEIHNNTQATLTKSQWESDATGLGINLSSTHEMNGAFPVGGKYFYLLGWTDTPFHIWFTMYRINTDGTISLEGGGWLTDTFGISTAFYNILCVNVQPSGEILVAYSDFSGINIHLQLLPRPTAMINGGFVFGSNNGRRTISELTGSYSASPATNRNFGGFQNRPCSLVGDKLYIYIGKGEMDWLAANSSGVGFNAYYKSLQPTYPNGVLLLANLVADGAGLLTYIFFGPVSDFGFPFDDIGLKFDGTAGTADDDYGPPQQSGSVVIFAKTSSDSVYQAGVRIYVDATLPVVAQFHGAFANSGDYSASSLYEPHIIFQQDNELYVKSVAAVSGAGDTVLGLFGSLPPTAVDVTPAYIIYRILTNEAFGFATDSLFGFTLSESRVDQISYLAAVAECESQGCYISVSYDNASNVLGIIDDLLSLYGGFLTENDGTVYFGVVKDSDASVRTLDNDHFVVEQGKPPVVVTKAAIDDGYNKVVFHYLDRQLDYNQNEVVVSEEVDMDFNGPRIKQWDTQFVMPGSLASQVAVRALWANLYGRDGFTFSTGWKDADLRPGNVVTLVDSFSPTLSTGRRVRLTKRQATETRGVFQWSAVQEYSYITNASISYTQIASISEGVGDLVDPAQAPLFQTAYELPREFQGATPEMFFGYGIAGQTMGAQLHLSVDGLSFVQAQDKQPYPISGVLGRDLELKGKGHVETGLDFYIFPSFGFSVTTPTFVQTYALDDITAATRAAGGGVVIVGSEAMAVQDLTLLGQNHYRAKYCFRGWGGSPISSHSSGDNFHAHAAGIFTHEITQDDIGTTLYYKIAPYNFVGKVADLSSLSIGSYRIKGDYWLPRQQPRTKFWVASAISWPGSTAFQHQYIGVVSGGCDVVLTWPLADNQEGYGAGGYGAGTYGHFTLADSVNWRVDVMSSNAVKVSSFSVSTSYFKYTLAQNSADFNGFGKNPIYKVTPYNVKGDGYVNDTRSLSLFW